MTARTPPTDTLDQTLADLAEDFDLLGDWEQRIEYVIELGKGLAPLDAADRTEANKVPGCAAQVWLASASSRMPNRPSQTLAPASIAAWSRCSGGVRTKPIRITRCAGLNVWFAQSIHFSPSARRALKC